MGLVPHIEVHPVDPSIFGGKQLQLLEAGLLSPYSVSLDGIGYWGPTNKIQVELLSRL
jgi:hypothetical protein